MFDSNFKHLEPFNMVAGKNALPTTPVLQLQASYLGAFVQLLKLINST